MKLNYFLDTSPLRKSPIYSKENNKSVQEASGADDDDIYNKLTQVDMQAQSNLNDSSEAHCHDRNKIDDEDSIYGMETQPLPEMFLNTNAQAPQELTSAAQDEEDSIYMMETQPMPEMFRNPSRDSVGNDAIFTNMKAQITQSSTPQRQSNRIADNTRRYNKSAKVRRISPDTDDDSIAKLIPKVMDESIDKLKVSDKQKNKKLKQMWLFVSSSDDEGLDELMSESKSGSVGKYLVELLQSGHYSCTVLIGGNENAVEYKVSYILVHFHCLR